MNKTRFLLTVAFLALGATSAVASSIPNSRGHWGAENAIRLHLGEFEPRGESQYWEDSRFDFTGEPDDFSDVAAGIDYARFLGQRLGFLASTSFFTGETDQAYIDFVDEFGNDILHTTELELATFTIGVTYNFTRRDQAIVPYVGAGGGLFAWRLAEFGDFIDFGLVEPEIFNEFFEDEGTTFGYYYQAGVDIPLARNVSVFGEARWTRAEGELEGDFAGLGDLDLSGRTISAGLTWSF